MWRAAVFHIIFLNSELKYLSFKLRLPFPFNTNFLRFSLRASPYFDTSSSCSTRIQRYASLVASSLHDCACHGVDPVHQLPSGTWPHTCVHAASRGPQSTPRLVELAPLQVHKKASLLLPPTATRVSSFYLITFPRWGGTGLSTTPTCLKMAHSIVIKLQKQCTRESLLEFAGRGWRSVIAVTACS